jgi:DNA-directed RNA polymerase subunit omega
MDPLIVYDCQKQVPNRFGLALAAAARARALRKGVPVRVQTAGLESTEVALREIASGAFTPKEIGVFLPGTSMPPLLGAPDQLCDSEPWQKQAVAPESLSRDTVH